MADKKRRKSGREHGNATEATTTAIELDTKGTATSTVKPSYSSNSSPSPDTGTPLPDDPKVLKENVKGLKSQLRRQKLKVLLPGPSVAQDVHPTLLAGR